LTFDAYIRKSDKWPDHFPELFQVPPLETYIFFVRAWLALHQGEILILKFENYKDNPAKVLKKALNFLAIDRSDKEISEACRLSTHQIAIENVKELEIETGRTFTVARRSKKNEYKETWKLSSQLCISKPSRRFLKNYREGHLDDSLWYHHLKIQNRKKFCSIRNSFDDRLTSLSDFEFVREIETKKLSGLALRENILRRHSSKLNNYMKFSQNDMHQRSLKFFENIVLEFGETQVFTELILKNIRELENYTKVELNKSLGIWYLLIKRLKKTSMNILIRFFIKMEKVEGI
jgi:hypothetical protein